MAEDSYLRVTREYFAETNAGDLDIPVKKLNKALEAYNKYLEKSLMDESPYIVENLQLALLQSKIDTIKGKYK